MRIYWDVECWLTYSSSEDINGSHIQLVYGVLQTSTKLVEPTIEQLEAEVKLHESMGSSFESYAKVIEDAITKLKCIQSEW